MVDHCYIKFCLKKSHSKQVVEVLTTPVRGISESESCIETKIKLNFYFHTFLWRLKMPS